MCGNVNFELVISSAVISQPCMGVSPGLAELPEAGGDLRCHVAERDAVFEPSDSSAGEGADFSLELPDLIQLCRFIFSELWPDRHKLTCC